MATTNAPWPWPDVDRSRRAWTDPVDVDLVIDAGEALPANVGALVGALPGS